MFRSNQGFACENPELKGLKVGRKALLCRPNGPLQDFEQCFVFLRNDRQALTCRVDQEEIKAEQLVGDD